jgi:multiple sugar transport system substrate-binding protein
MTVRHSFRAALSIALALFYVLILTGGCGTLNPSKPPVKPPASETPQPTSTATEQARGPVSRLIRIWLPARFDPASSVPGQLLKQRLDDFVASHSGLHIEVRIKDEATLLDALTLTNAAAPVVLPDLVILPRPDLETAALKGLIFPFDRTTDLNNAEDWFPYARDAARIQDTVYGLPFASDALDLVYNPAKIDNVSTWAAVLKGDKFAAPVADPQALLALSLYQSLGTGLLDSQGRPTVDEASLTQMLNLFADSRQSLLPVSFQFQTDDKVWQAYRAGDADIVVTWASRYLTKANVDMAAAPLLGLDGQPYTLATVWCWAQANPNTEQRSLTAELAETLMDPVFLAALTAEAGYLPTRQSALDEWTDVGRKRLADQVVSSAHLIPSSDVTLTLGPIIKQAVLGVLNGRSPQQASQDAITHLK